MKIRQDLTIKELLTRFPNGFAISPNGILFESIGQSKEPDGVIMLLGKKGGYLTVSFPEILEDDGFFLDEK